VIMLRLRHGSTLHQRVPACNRSGIFLSPGIAMALAATYYEL